MGEIYLADDSELKRQVALKFLPANMSTDATFRERFFREARSAAALNHPNVVTMYEVAQTQGWIFIAMEYIDGRALRDLMDAGQLSLENTVDYLGQVCDGLVAAHRAGLVHRDIKPHNIMIDRDGRVRVLDFGLAKGQADQQLTQDGTALGTVSYMSPEQGQGTDVDSRSDVFSVGIVLYEMLTGRQPFSGGSMVATINAIINDSPASLQEARPGLPEQCQSIVDRALAKDPTARYQDIAEMARDLREILRPEASSPHLPLATATRPAAVQSLAVLHLRNLGSPEDEFLCYGITEDLIVDLTRIGSVRVSSMRSVLKYKESDADLEEIAGSLNVGLILDGSLHKTADAIRVSAQLVDAKTGENLWAQRWVEAPENLVRVKKDLADGVIQAMNVAQTVIAQAQVGRPEATDAEAYENYLKAKYTFRRKKERTDVDIALGFYALALKQEPTLIAARAGLAEIMMYNGDMASAKIELESALASAAGKDHLAGRIDLLIMLARLHVKKSDFEQAIERADEALALARDINNLDSEANILGVKISALQPQARFEEAIQCFDRLLQISRELDDQDRVAESLKNMGVAYSRQGDYDQAMELYQEALGIAVRREDLSLQAACLANLGNVNFYRGEPELASQNYEQALKLAEQIGSQDLVARQRLNLGLMHVIGGRFRQGLEMLLKAGEIFKGSGDQASYAMTLVNISQARLTVGEVDQAIADSEEAITIAHKIGHPQAETNALVQLGSAYFFRRDVEKASEYFQRALELAEKSSMARNLAHIHLALVKLCFYCKDFKQCKNHAAKALSLAGELGEKSIATLSQASAAAVEACEGLFHAGLRKLQNAYKGIDQISDQEITLQLKALLGQVLLWHGKTDQDREDGRNILREGLTIARSKSLAPEISFIEEILAGDGTAALPMAPSMARDSEQTHSPFDEELTVIVERVKNAKPME